MTSVARSTRVRDHLGRLAILVALLVLGASGVAQMLIWGHTSSLLLGPDPRRFGLVALVFLGGLVIGSTRERRGGAPAGGGDGLGPLRLTILAIAVAGTLAMPSVFAMASIFVDPWVPALTLTVWSGLLGLLTGGAIRQVARHPTATPFVQDHTVPGVAGVGAFVGSVAFLAVLELQVSLVLASIATAGIVALGGIGLVPLRHSHGVGRLWAWGAWTVQAGLGGVLAWLVLAGSADVGDFLGSVPLP